MKEVGYWVLVFILALCFSLLLGLTPYAIYHFGFIAYSGPT